MNSDFETNRVAALDQALRNLPVVSAPGTLIPGVMSRIERQAAIPWYRQPWPAWPRLAQAASLVLLSALFTGLCLAGGELAHSEPVAILARHLGQWCSELALALRTFGTLADAVGLIGKHLGAGFIAAGLLVATCSYLACIGLGTAAVKFALARTRN